MIAVVRNHILAFIFLVLLQALVLDHLDLARGWVVPYLYVLFLIALPFETPPWATLLLGFALGMAMDFFSSTPGMHAGACVLMAYGRLLMLRLLAPRDGYDPLKRPNVHDMGLAWYMTFAGTLIVLHHLWLFFIEVYRFDDFFSTLLRALMSAAATMVLCLLAQALTSRGARAR
ncbi:MAG: rod shape-determining protein MreD [Flavobacteriales bacterium]|nr:rod shape-determining protein MreD [Flavobacteriales bacterium]MCL4280744.1 rod shape-determining protein MreD [Flavobacteriales bacterium]